MAERLLAPYARAGAFVAADGAIRRSKNVDSVTKTSTGRYRVTVAATIDTSTCLPQVTAHAGADWGTEVYVRAITDDPHGLEVLTSCKGTATNEPFYLTIL